MIYFNSIKGAYKNSDFFLRSRKHRAENRSLQGVNEDSSTELTLKSGKKCIFRGALKTLIRVFVTLIACSFYVHASEESSFSDDVSFFNFDSLVVFNKDGEEYTDNNKKLRIIISDRLIVKLKASFDAKKIIFKYDWVDNLNLIFSGKESRIFLVSLGESISIQEAIRQLGLIPEVELVQPDILQLPYEPSQKETSDGLRLFQHQGEPHVHSHLSDEERVERTNNRYLRYLQDYGVEALWSKTTGRGVRLAIIDDGFNLSLPSLAHVKPAFTYDVFSQSQDVKPRTENDSHGTKVAGIIFSSHKTGILKGIAPDAELIALRNTLTWTSHTLLAFQLAQLNNVDVINCSWLSHWLIEPINYAVEELATNGRNGKGVAVVFSSGNKGKEIMPFQTEASIEKAIVVGSQNMLARRLPNSGYGKSVDVNNYGLKIKISAADGV